MGFLNAPGVKGKLKEQPEDFVVEEISEYGKVVKVNTQYTPEQLGYSPDPSSMFATFVLQKRNWNTIQALIAVAKRLGRGKRSVGYAGAKDRRAVTAQLASLYGVKAEELSKIRIKDISINGAWQGKPVELGSNIGNAFTIAIRACEAPESILKLDEELKANNYLMPNYFGAQRFGMRGINASTGIHILKGELEEAAMEFLTNTSNEKNEQSVEARRELAETRDFKRALERFPKYLKPERSMLAKLSANGRDFAGAFRSLPRGLLIMFIHAVQSEIFNKELDLRLKEKDFSSELYAGKNFYGFPDEKNISKEPSAFPIGNIVGYETSPNQYEQEVLESMGISEKDFYVRHMPELSMRGSHRPLLVNVKDMHYTIEGRDVKLYFELPAGSYASVLLEELNK